MNGLEEYTETCLEFAKYTRKWEALGDAFYGSQADGWGDRAPESSGLDVSWAFHKTAKEIRQRAPEEFVEQLLADVERGVDEEFDREQWAGLLKEYRNRF